MGTGRIPGCRISASGDSAGRRSLEGEGNASAEQPVDDYELANAARSSQFGTPTDALKTLSHDRDTGSATRCWAGGLQGTQALAGSLPVGHADCPVLQSAFPGLQAMRD